MVKPARVQEENVCPFLFHFLSFKEAVHHTAHWLIVRTPVLLYICISLNAPHLFQSFITMKTHKTFCISDFKLSHVGIRFVL